MISRAELARKQPTTPVTVLAGELAALLDRVAEAERLARAVPRPEFTVAPGDGSARTAPPLTAGGVLVAEAESHDADCCRPASNVADENGGTPLGCVRGSQSLRNDLSGSDPLAVHGGWET